ncbi:MAG: phosphotransferase [Alphaproteobacteria bacterium]
MAITFEEIRERFSAEQRARGAPPTRREHLPLTYESIPKEWLTAVLADKAPGAAVLSHTLGPRDEGTSSRRTMQLVWNEAGQKAGLPGSIFCKGTLTLESRYLLGMNEGVQAEVNFYNLVRPGLNVISPEPLFARFDPVSLNSIIILNDMSGKVEFGRIDTEMTLNLARSQMRQLANLHGRFYRSPELETTLAPFSTWETFFTVTAEDAGFADACVRGFSQAKSVIPPRLFQHEPEVWPATLRCVARHRELPRTFIHSDVHLKNWYITPEGEMGMNDWQCCSKGNWSRDVAYCISTALEPEKRRAWERELLQYYLDQLAAAGGERINFDEAWLLYRQQLFAALAWWTGTLGQPPDAPLMQPAPTSMEFIRRMATAIDDLSALDSF